MSDCWIIDNIAAALDQFETTMQVMPISDMIKTGGIQYFSSRLNLHGNRPRFWLNKWAWNREDHPSLASIQFLPRAGIMMKRSGWQCWKPGTGYRILITPDALQAYDHLSHFSALCKHY